MALEISLNEAEGIVKVFDEEGYSVGSQVVPNVLLYFILQELKTLNKNLAEKTQAAPTTVPTTEAS